MKIKSGFFHRTYLFITRQLLTLIKSKLHVYLKLSTGASGEPTTVMSSGAMISGSSIPLTSTQGVTGVLVRTDAGTLVIGVEVATLDGGLPGVVTGVVTVVTSSEVISNFRNWLKKVKKQGFDQHNLNKHYSGVPFIRSIEGVTSV